MLAEEIRDYCLEKKGVTEGFPFNETTLVFKVGSKMFLLMALDTPPLAFSAKNKEDNNLELREKYYQISGAYHMNKTHWNSVICEGLKPDLIKKLIDDSYELVFNSLTKKAKEEILSS
jgi:predicted DNA-binding protein (MmcQ/YjbR family)